jgi:hypothetical protein
MERKKPTPKKTVTKKTPPESKREAKDKEYQKIYDEILSMIGDLGYSLNKSLKIKRISAETFYKLREKTSDNAKNYAHACARRADAIFEEMFEIADRLEKDATPFVGANFIQRARLQIDTRKWALSKMNPKKYGDRIEVAGDPDAPIQTTVINLGNGTKPEDE